MVKIVCFSVSLQMPPFTRVVHVIGYGMGERHIGRGCKLQIWGTCNLVIWM